MKVLQEITVKIVQIPQEKPLPPDQYIWDETEWKIWTKSYATAIKNLIEIRFKDMVSGFAICIEGVDDTPGLWVGKEFIPLKKGDI